MFSSYPLTLEHLCARKRTGCSLLTFILCNRCLTSFLAGTSLTHNISVASLRHLYQDNEKISPRLRPQKDWPCRPCHIAGVDEEGQQGSNSQDLGLRSVFYATEVQGRCLKGILDPATYRLQTCESVPWFHEDILLHTGGLRTQLFLLSGVHLNSPRLLCIVTSPC